ncbi:hypothetical protein ACJW30_11G187900 [Castanea mollissima]
MGRILMRRRSALLLRLPRFISLLPLLQQGPMPWYSTGNNIRSNDPNSLEDILRKGFSTGVSYMYSSLFEVSQWCNAVNLLGKRRKITLISCFGEVSGSHGMERNIFYLISKSSYSTSSNPRWGIACKNDIMLIYVPHGQGSIVF